MAIRVRSLFREELRKEVNITTFGGYACGCLSIIIPHEDEHEPHRIVLLAPFLIGRMINVHVSS